MISASAGSRRVAVVMLAGRGWLGVFHALSLQDCDASPTILL